MIYFSPHLDDAVLSCGEQIAVDEEPMVITVLAGSPGVKPVTQYDVNCGFRNGEEAVMYRRWEDRRAVAVLGGEHLHLDYLDGQYNDPPTVGDLKAWLPTYIEGRPPDEAIYAPLGINHEDHVLVSDAAISVAKRTGRRLFLWEDLPSRVTYPELVGLRMDSLGQRLTFYPRHPAPGDVELKEKALWCYRSQIRCGLPWRCALVTERLWEVTWPVD
jgi:LmbE family N-acetylglucosaminyl deacetylase